MYYKITFKYANLFLVWKVGTIFVDCGWNVVKHSQWGVTDWVWHLLVQILFKKLKLNFDGRCGFLELVWDENYFSNTLRILIDFFVAGFSSICPTRSLDTEFDCQRQYLIWREIFRKEVQESHRSLCSSTWSCNSFWWGSNGNWRKGQFVCRLQS